jgi:hypothetical protein
VTSRLGTGKPLTFFYSVADKATQTRSNGQQKQNKKQIEDYIKGTGSPDGLKYFLYVWIDVGINKRRWWFLNFFKVSPEAFH